MDVDTCKQKVDAEQFTYWKAKFKRQPWGPQWEDYRFYVLTEMICNVLNMFLKKGARRIKASPFFPNLAEMLGEDMAVDESKWQSPETVWNNLMMWVKAFSGNNRKQ